jgi:ACR3 family arsenite efflux pump ArsB
MEQLPLMYLLMRWLRVEHNVAAPVAMIGASNFTRSRILRPHWFCLGGSRRA